MLLLLAQLTFGSVQYWGSLSILMPETMTAFLTKFQWEDQTTSGLYESTQDGCCKGKGTTLFSFMFAWKQS